MHWAIRSLRRRRAKGRLSRSALDTVPIQRGASYLPFDILDLYEARPEIMSASLKTIMDLFEQDLIVALGILNSMNLAELDKAVSTWSGSFGATKPIIQYEASEMPIPTLPNRAQLEFCSESTYLLVGCLGGLGRSLTSWMMESGARRFTILSRSGTDSKSASKLVKDIEAAGAIVQVVRGDVTSHDDVVRAIRGVPSQHPIKGVVHAAMVLRVSG